MTRVMAQDQRTKKELVDVSGIEAPPLVESYYYHGWWLPKDALPRWRRWLGLRDDD